MTKSEQAYNLKIQGMTNSEIASIIGTDRKTVPTLAKGHMLSHGLLPWGQGQTVGTVADSSAKYGAETSDYRGDSLKALKAAKHLIRGFKDVADSEIAKAIGDVAKACIDVLK